MKKFITSLDDDVFNMEDFDTEQDAIDYMVDDLPVGEDFYIGESRKITMKSLV